MSLARPTYLVRGSPAPIFSCASSFLSCSLRALLLAWYTASNCCHASLAVLHLSIRGRWCSLTFSPSRASAFWSLSALVSSPLTADHSPLEIRRNFILTLHVA